MQTQRPSSSPPPSWQEQAIAKSEIITDAWEVTKTYAGRLAEWVLFGCMVCNIIEILPGVSLWPVLTNSVLGVQVVMLDVGGFSLASMAEQARERGDERAARRAALTGWVLIGIMIVTLLLVTVGLLWPVTRPITDGAEKALILLRVIMTVIYGHVIHRLRRASLAAQAAQTQVEAVAERIEHLNGICAELQVRLSESERRVSEQYSELVGRTAKSLSSQFMMQLERTVSELVSRTELLSLTERVQAQSDLLSELTALSETTQQAWQALPSQVRALVEQEVQTALAAKTEQERKATPNHVRSSLAVVNTGQTLHRANVTEQRANRTEQEKGAFVRRCLTEMPTIRNIDIQRKAREQGLSISPAYISEVRKAFATEAQSA